MSTLFLDRAGLALRHEGAALVLYERGERRGTVPVKLIDRVVIQGAAIEMTTGALLRLAEAGAAVLFLAARKSSQSALLLGPSHNDAAVRLAQSSLVSDQAARSHWSRDLVRRKLRRQYAFLDHLRRARPDARKPLTDAKLAVGKICDAISATTLTITALRGHEGAAAAQYFKGLQAVFPSNLEFKGRNRRPPKDPVNACLSLAYTLLHFDAVRAAHAAGLDPMIGLYHRPSFGRESLACDLVEPLRPVVDRWVWRLLADRKLRHEHFNVDKGACLLSKAGRAHFYPEWETAANWHRRHLRRQCAIIARSLRHKGAALMEAIPGFEDEPPTDESADALHGPASRETDT